MREVAANELAAADAPGHYMYELRRRTPKESETKAMIEAKGWLVGRLIQVNGKPLTPQQRKKEDERLARLVSDTNALHKEQTDQAEDERRVRNLVKALPEAFVYNNDGFDTNSAGDRLERLAFEPNPAYHPTTGELTVLTGMKGTMLIDTRAMRLVRIQTNLFRSVSFGWGILARLDPGGTFLLEEAPVDSGRWAIKTMALHFTGKILLFKDLRIESRITTSDFRRMRDDLTLVQGLELLKDQDEMTTN